MEILQKEFLQWYEELEKQMQCYFCREEFSGSIIYSCEFGHNICFSCKVENCLACKSPQPFIQNHLAQLLVTQLTDLKHKADEIQWSDVKPVKPKTANTSCQIKAKVANKMCSVTDKDLKESPDKKSPKDKTEPDNNPNIPPGFYPCLNKFCKFVGTYTNIITHFASNHSSQYEEVSFQGLPYSKSWELDYSGDNSQIIRVFDIKKLGLFVLHFFINGDGEMKGSVLLYNIRKNSEKYEYNLEIECDGKKISQALVVDTCRIPEHVLYDSKNGLFISKNVLLYNTLRSKLKFKCLIEIKEVSKTAEDSASLQKQSENASSEHRQRRENRQAYNHNKNDNKQQRLNNNSQSKPVQKNVNQYKNKETSIPPLLETKISTPSAPNTSQFVVNRMPGPTQSNQTLYPNLKNYQPPLMQLGVQQHSPKMNSPYGNIEPSFFPLPPPPPVNYEYQRNPPIYERTHYINLQQTAAIRPSAPVVDHERQEKIKAGVEAVQKAHLKKFGVQSVDVSDEAVDVSSIGGTRRNNSSKKGNGSNSQQKSDCVIN